jgi:hypothetical protein
MRRKLTFWVSLLAVITATLVLLVAAYGQGGPAPGRMVVVYVRSQDLFFDSIVNGPLPPRGPFQLLEMGPNGLETDFGPGDPGYLGGRWRMDTTGDGVPDIYFSCPLLPPGREEP